VARVDHTWVGGGVEAHAHLGFRPDRVRCWAVFAEHEDQLVVTGRLCALSLLFWPGQKIVLGPKWWGREVEFQDELHEDDD
jgi:hypothetical protein